MDEEVKIINIQLIATYLYIASLIISLFLTYNDKNKTLNKKGLFSKKKENQLSIFNRILVVGLSLTFLYISYKNRNIAISKNESVNPFNLQLIASEIATLSAIIVLYVVITSGEYSIIASLENPNI